ncbi:helix-turn-helix transcriptional regulator [Bradyrhizobium sp. Arg68]|uniref:AraC family transcriptional regulator n=1 Tax=Bradyrhizobium ivorense TaxID=2511166 RepID=UPI001E602FFE|nr:helix-turn-helix domain-containing protein [Bradyrhizobium ivorense]MCC8938691.1 helix-turn-helix transcriptional regulator [Bradyrhizobium ivorense]
MRGGAVVLLLFRIVTLARDARSNQVSRYSALLLIGIAAYVVESAPNFGALDLRWRCLVHLVGAGAPVAFWLTMGAIFTDEFRPRWYHALAWLVFIMLGVLETLGRPTYTSAALHSALLLLCLLLGIWHVLAGRATDLVEGRRRLRVWYAVAIALYTVLSVASDWVWPGALSSAPLSLANAAALVGLIFLFAALGSLASTGEPMAPAMARAGSKPSANGSGPAASADAALVAALRRLIDHDKVYREPDLSVTSLAQKLDIPEYRLRRLINGQLGHRNFNAFVNGYRLKEVEAALGDPGQAEVPILTIALDAGFGSIGPFNRAFKAHTGLTPTEYRRARLGGAEGAEPLPIPK